MSPRAQTRPLDDPKLWRRLIARTHPDAGGDHELFIWCGTLKDAVCGGELQVQPRSERHAPPRPPDDKPRIPYPVGTDFGAGTRAAVAMAVAGTPYERVLFLLVDVRPLAHLAREQERGASYKQLAAIAHIWGMTKTERLGWYRVAEEIPLSDRHAAYIISKLKKRAA